MVLSKALTIYGPQFRPLYNWARFFDPSHYVHLEDYEREAHRTEIMFSGLEKDERRDV